MKQLKPSEKVLLDHLKDDKFKSLWDAGEARRRVVSALIGERIAKNFNQRQLAKKIGIKQPSLARIESGTAQPSFSLLTKIAKALELKVEIKLVPLG